MYDRYKLVNIDGRDKFEEKTRQLQQFNKYFPNAVTG